MNQNSLTEVETIDGETSIILSLKQKELGEFITNLLGQQQSIERDFDESFDIDHEWLLNLHDLLNQRITQQADAKLVNFSAVIYFNGGLKRTLTSIEAFRSYHETKKNIPVGIKIVWYYLVLFPGKTHPEKQEISFSANVHLKQKSYKGKKRSFKDFINSTIGINDQERSSVNYNIEHTERTWGDDLEVIISNQLDDVIRGGELKFQFFQFLRIVFSFLALMFFMTYPLYSIIGSVDVSRGLVAEAYNEYKTLNASGIISIESVETKLDAIANMMALSSTNSSTLGFSSLSIILGPVFVYLFLILSKNVKSSFLVLSISSKLYKEKKLKAERKSSMVTIFVYVSAIIGSIIANYGYSWLVSA